MSPRFEIALPTRPVLSHAADGVRANGLLFVAGVLPVDMGGMLVGAGDVDEQARHVFAALGEILDAAGCSRRDVAWVNVYLTAIEDRSRVEAQLQTAFSGSRPAGTLVCVRGLAIPGAGIEIDAVAAVP